MKRKEMERKRRRKKTTKKLNLLAILKYSFGPAQSGNRHGET
jgi:hypothetical protein